jgi:hypothetical protein
MLMASYPLRGMPDPAENRRPKLTWPPDILNVYTTRYITPCNFHHQARDLPFGVEFIYQGPSILIVVETK